MGKGERIVWLKLEARHYEFLASDNSEEFGAARRAHIRKIVEIYTVALSKLDCAKDDCVKDGGAASSGGLPLEGSSSARSMSCSFVRSNKRARVMCSKGTSSACSMSVCEKTSPSARGLSESKLQRIEETVSVKCLGEERDVTSCRCHLVQGPAGEKHGGCLASGSKVTAMSKWSCVASRREHECRASVACRRRQLLLQVISAWEKHSAPWWLCRQVPKRCEMVWMMHPL